MGKKNNETEIPENAHLVKYDCITNGGNDCSNNNEYLVTGSNVDLSKTGTKRNYNFVGWNTDKDSKEALTELTVGDTDITLYAIFEAKDTTEPIIDSVNTTTTTNSITIVVAAHDNESGIAKYEFSINDGDYVDNGNNNIYTFTGLTASTTYSISVRITNGVGLSITNFNGEAVDLKDSVITTGDGLYEDNYESGRYIYRGTKPNNYIKFNDELWRIMAIESDGTLKIVRDELLNKIPWDQHSNNWNHPADINTYLNDEYYDSIINQKQIVTHNFNTGSIIVSNEDLKTQTNDEKGTLWSGKVGLMTASDFIKANTNETLCGNFLLLENNKSECKSTNYLSSQCFWTITAVQDGEEVIAQSNSGRLYKESLNVDYCYSRPVVYLDNSTVIKKGDGTYNSPYEITMYAYTNFIEKPLFTEESSENSKIITINYPEGENLKYEYQIDNGPWQIANQTQTLEFDQNSTIIARVSDNVNVITNSYTVYFSAEIGGQNIILKSNGDGLYKDEYEENRYVYKGVNPNNYIKFSDDEIWRIISKESDGTYKIIKTKTIGVEKWDITEESIIGEDWNYAKPTTLNTYLNETYYNSLNENIKNNIVSHDWAIGEVEWGNDNLNKQISIEKSILWKGNVGLINVSDQIRANSNTKECGTHKLSYDNNSTCFKTNWLHFNGNNGGYWTISGELYFRADIPFTIYLVSDSRGYANTTYYSDNMGVIPAVFINSDIKLSGTGTETEPYEIIN